MRIALFTLESLSNATAVRRFVAAHAQDIVLLGLSDPYRKSSGGATGQFLRHLRRSGPRFVPYLAVNFSLPEIARGLRGLLGLTPDVERTPLARLARERGIKTVTVSDVNGPEMRRLLAACGADLILSFHFDQIFTAETLAATPRGGINVHPSLLPHHRGPVPTLYALSEIPPMTGVTVHRLVPQIDAGIILSQAPVSLPPDSSAISAAAALHEAALPLLDRLLDDDFRSDGQSSETHILPYCPFPDRATLARAAARHVALVRWRDLWRALGGYG